MFDFVPILQYSRYFHIVLLFLVLIVLLQCHRGNILTDNTVRMNAAWGVIFTIVLTAYIGLRPVNAVFGDTINYAKGFEEMANSTEPFKLTSNRDWLFYNTMQWFAKHSDIHAFFLLCAIVYIAPLWLATVRIFKEYYYLPLLVIFCMFTFWQYGVNGIRNGMAASLFILAMTYVDKLPVAALLCVAAVGTHSSVYLMVGAAILAWFIKNSYWYLAAWIACVIVSYVVGGRIQAFLADIPFFGGYDTISGYLTGSNMVGEVVQMSMTFRWDFLIYSALGVAVGYYFIFVQRFNDEYYHWIYNTFLVTNAFWVLIIRVAYSNRFAQISWFIMPLVLIYPFLKKRFWVNHEKMLGYGLVVFYAFSFYFNILKS